MLFSEAELELDFLDFCNQKDCTYTNLDEGKLAYGVSVYSYIRHVYNTYDLGILRSLMKEAFTFGKKEYPEYENKKKLLMQSMRFLYGGSLDYTFGKGNWSFGGGVVGFNNIREFIDVSLYFVALVSGCTDESKIDRFLNVVIENPTMIATHWSRIFMRETTLQNNASAKSITFVTSGIGDAVGDFMTESGEYHIALEIYNFLPYFSMDVISDSASRRSQVPFLCYSASLNPKKTEEFTTIYYKGEPVNLIHVTPERIVEDIETETIFHEPIIHRFIPDMWMWNWQFPEGSNEAMVLLDYYLLPGDESESLT